MGTANFLYKDKLFVVETNDDDDYDRLDELGCDMYDLLSELNCSISAKRKNLDIEIINEKKPTWSENDDNHRSFCARRHGNIIIRSEFMGLALKLNLEVLVRSGYYDHVNIDHNARLFVDGIDFDEDTDAYDIMDYFDTSVINEGMRVLQRHNFDNRLEAMRELASEIFNYIGTALGTEYNSGATASNGETRYHKVDDTNTEFKHMKWAA